MMKALLVGDSGTGKTAYMDRVVSGEFGNPTVTIGVNVCEYNVRLSGKPSVCIQFWDCGGGFNELHKSYYQGAKGAIVMFDVHDPTSFQNVPTWIRKIREHCGSIPIVVCGNKIDLLDRQVSVQECKELARQEKYFDLSVRSCYNWEKPLLWLAQEYLETIGEPSFSSTGSDVPPTSKLCPICAK